MIVVYNLSHTPKIKIDLIYGFSFKIDQEPRERSAGSRATNARFGHRGLDLMLCHAR